jgi:hypothetical protein
VGRGGSAVRSGGRRGRHYVVMWLASTLCWWSLALRRDDAQRLHPGLCDPATGTVVFSLGTDLESKALHAHIKLQCKCHRRTI